METLFVAALGAIILPFFVIFFLKRPDLSTVAILTLVFANVFVLAKRKLGLPQIVVASPFLLLAFPLANHLLIKRQKVIFDYAFCLMLLFLLVLLASTMLFAQDMGAALDYLLTYCTEGLFLYFIIVNVVRNLPTLRRVTWVLLVCGALLGSLALYQEVTHEKNNNFGGLAQTDSARLAIQEDGGVGGIAAKAPDGRNDLNRSQGPIGEPNRWAQTLTVLLPLGLFLMRGERRWVLRVVAGTATILVLSGVLLTFSRGAFLAIVGMILLMTLLGYIRLYQIFAIFAVMGVLIITFPNCLKRLDTLRGVEGLVSDESEMKPDGATRGRLTEMLASSYAFLDHPILGVGPGQYTKVYSEEYMSNPEIAFRHITTTRRAHCLYTEMAAETGIIGLMIFLSIVGLILSQLWRLRRATLQGPKIVNSFVVSFMLSITAYMATAIFLHLAYQRYFWLLIGLASATVHIASSEISHSTTAAEQVPQENGRNHRMAEWGFQ